MTTGPAVPPRGLRASHVDREQAISALKAAFVHGRLTGDEFDARVGQALAARTHAELAAITADIPVGPMGVQPVRRPNQPALSVKSGVCVTVSAAMLAAVQWAAAWSAGSATASEPKIMQKHRDGNQLGIWSERAMLRQCGAVEPRTHHMVEKPG